MILVGTFLIVESELISTIYSNLKIYIMKAIMDNQKINNTDFDLIKLGSNENSQDIKIVNYIEKQN